MSVGFELLGKGSFLFRILNCGWANRLFIVGPAVEGNNVYSVAFLGGFDDARPRIGFNVLS